MNAVDAANLILHYTRRFMLTLGMFSLVVASFLGCVWWACRDEGV